MTTDNERDGTLPDGGVTSSRETRALAARLAAEVCRGAEPSGASLLAYMILFESFLIQGGDATANLVGWDVVERPPVSLASVRTRLKDFLT